VEAILRIYPALAICVLVSAFLIAPLFSELSLGGYLSSFSGVKYVAKVLLLYATYQIPTVKFYDQEIKHLGDIVNGSLWTISMEIYCYLILFFLAALELVSIRSHCSDFFRRQRSISLVPRGNAAVERSDDQSILHCSLLLRWRRDVLHSRQYGLSRRIALGCVIGLLLFAPTGHLFVVSPILAAYPLIYLGMSASIPLGNATRFGDLSYGTYLYGWPVTQVVRSVAGTALSGWGLFLISLPLAMACGWLSWHLVEKHALALKAVIRRSPDSLRASVSDEKPSQIT
jgi:peptidoglycan/LPS O-acetylase OafA/YrhL